MSSSCSPSTCLSIQAMRCSGGSRSSSSSSQPQLGAGLGGGLFREQEERGVSSPRGRPKKRKNRRFFRCAWHSLMAIRASEGAEGVAVAQLRQWSNAATKLFGVISRASSRHRKQPAGPSRRCSRCASCTGPSWWPVAAVQPAPAPCSWSTGGTWRGLLSRTHAQAWNVRLGQGHHHGQRARGRSQGREGTASGRLTPGKKNLFRVPRPPPPPQPSTRANHSFSSASAPLFPCSRLHGEIRLALQTRN